MVILAPVVLFSSMVAVQAALVFHARAVVTAAAADAARTVQLEGGTAQDGHAVAEQLLGGSSTLLVEPHVHIDENAGGHVTVQVTARVTSLIPGWDPTVNGHAHGVREEFKAETQR